MEKTFDITAEMVHVLERHKLHGTRYVHLAEETRTAFFDGSIKQEAAKKRVASRQTRRPAPQVRAPLPVPEAAPKPTSIRHQCPLTQMDLAALETCVATCQNCPLHQSRKQTVFGAGSPKARIMFIGEAPGRDEDEQGKPFVGAAGQLLDKMIAAMQFTRDDIYIGNIVKCRPPGNRTPQEDEAKACLPYLERQIELIKPEVIVLLGAVPLKYLLGAQGITRLHGQWMDYHGIPVMPTYHPAFLLRISQKKREAWQDLQKVMKRLGKDPSTTIKAMQKPGSESR